LKRTRRIEIVRYRRQVTLSSRDSEASGELDARIIIPGISPGDFQGAPEQPENTPSWFTRQMWKWIRLLRE